MWPDNETEIDLLGFEFLVDSLVVALSEPRLLPLTVGVLGDWGSGKSSLMGLACAELSQPAEAESPADGVYACVRFSPWQYEDYEDVKVSLMSAVLARLAEEVVGDAEQQEEVGRLRTFARSLRRGGRRVARDGVTLLPSAVPLVAGMVDPGLDPGVVSLLQQGTQTATSGMAQRLSDPAAAPVAEDGAPVTDVAEFRRRFGDLIASLEHVAAVVVFIDDLDRCLPETVVNTFEAIRLLLGAPRAAFVVAANQKIVESAVDARYPELRGDGRVPSGIGAQYLEKMLQVKITVPALAVPEAVTYINLLLAELHLSEPDFQVVRQHVATQRAANALEVVFTLGTLDDLQVSVPPGLVADLQWAAAIAPVLAAGSRGNPRQIKQFLNTLQLRRRSAARRSVTLDPAVLAKLMLLESQHFDGFQQLFDWQIASGGPSCPQLATAEELVRAETHTEQTEQPGEPSAAPAADGDRPARSRPAKRQPTPPPVDEAVRSWAADPMIHDWLDLPPALANVDLRPYFTYSRDRLSLAAVSANRLSGSQRRLLGQLLGPTDAVRRAGITAVTAATPTDRAAVVDALAQALLTRTEEAFVAVCETAERVEDTREVLLRALERLPAAAVPAIHVPQVARLRAADPRADALLNKWAAARPDLARMADIARRPPRR